MDITAYLDRINYRGSRQPNLGTLRALHRAHLMAVPFENLDISLGQPILLDEKRLFEKIVSRKRGGFCYELNGLFAALLGALGFEVHRLAARVANGQGGYGIPFDHMTLLVKLDERWLVDVGFGESFLLPLNLDERGIQQQPTGSYRIIDHDEQLIYLREEDGNWAPQYLFSLQPYRLADFQDGCDYHQTSPTSTFTQKRVYSLAMQQGRLTLSDRKLTITTNGRREEQEVASESEYLRLLEACFGLVIDPR